MKRTVKKEVKRNVKNSVKKDVRTAKTEQECRAIMRRMCNISATMAKAYKDLKKDVLPPGWERHHVVQDAEMLLLESAYESGMGITIPLFGGSKIPGPPHWIINKFQRQYRKILSPVKLAKIGLRKAGCSKRS